MTHFLIKAILGLIVLSVGTLIVVNAVPPLKANILEAVNPRIKQQRLVDELKENLDALTLDLAKTNIGTVAATKTKTLIAESQMLLQQVSELNEEHSGVVSGIVEKVVDAVIGNFTNNEPSPSPTPTVVTVTVTVTPSPCN